MNDGSSAVVLLHWSCVIEMGPAGGNAAADRGVVVEGPVGHHTRDVWHSRRRRELKTMAERK